MLKLKTAKASKPEPVKIVEFTNLPAQEAFPLRSQEAKDRIAAALKDAGLPD